eukprot:PhM_4_TR15552/c0_g1_i1/m.725
MTDNVFPPTILDLTKSNTSDVLIVDDGDDDEEEKVDLEPNGNASQDQTLLQKAAVVDDDDEDVNEMKLEDTLVINRDDTAVTVEDVDPKTPHNDHVETTARLLPVVSSGIGAFLTPEGDTSPSKQQRQTSILTYFSNAPPANNAKETEKVYPLAEAAPEVDINEQTSPPPELSPGLPSVEPSVPMGCTCKTLKLPPGFKPKPRRHITCRKCSSHFHLPCVGISTDLRTMFPPFGTSTWTCPTCASKEDARLHYLTRPVLRCQSCRKGFDASEYVPSDMFHIVLAPDTKWVCPACCLTSQ